MEKQFYRANLPHLQPREETFFVTFRLHGSIPKQVIDRMKNEYEWTIQALEKEVEKAKKEVDGKQDSSREKDFKKRCYQEQKRYFLKYDNYLDSKILNEPHWLESPELAEIVANSFHYFDGRHYELYSFCIMSNHVHILLKLLPESPMLWKVLQSIKKYSAKLINERLGRQGRFWARESYDHLVRQNEFDRILIYILNNPVKAGIVQQWDQYPFNYCRKDLK